MGRISPSSSRRDSKSVAGICDCAYNAEDGRKDKRRASALIAAGLALALVGCAQNRQQADAAETQDQRPEGIQNYEKGAPMNGREISNGPGAFSGQEGGFVIFRK